MTAASPVELLEALRAANPGREDCITCREQAEACCTQHVDRPREPRLVSLRKCDPAWTAPWDQTRNLTREPAPF